MRKRKMELFTCGIVLGLALLTSCASVSTVTPAVSAPPPSLSASQSSPSPSPSLSTSPAPALSPSPKPSPASTSSFPSHTPDSAVHVKTDYSQLTPYKPPLEVYTRLSPDYMPDLVPSKNYGPLLPYVGAQLYGKGAVYPVTSRYGLVTAGGMIVTDAVYSDIARPDISLPFYILRRELDGVVSKNPSDIFRYALCALDGSWTTPFDYTGFRLRASVIIMIRDDKTNDADVRDFSGRVLFNTKKLGLKTRTVTGIASLNYGHRSGPFISDSRYIGTRDDHYGSGCFPLQLTNENYVYVDEASGKILSAEYDRAADFSGGLAAVQKNGLWGYIDRTFASVIPAQYKTAGPFFSGHALVQLSSGQYAVIGTDGKVQLGPERYISLLYDLYSVSHDGKTDKYDINLNYLETEDKNLQIGTVGGGWYYTTSDRQTVVFHNGKKYTIPAVKWILNVTDNLLQCHIYTKSDYGECIMTLDGKTLLPYAAHTSISLVKNPETGDIYAIAYDSTAKTARVEDLSGKVLFTADGTVTYNEQVNLFSIQSERYFAVVDATGKTVFRKSLLDSLPD